MVAGVGGGDGDAGGVRGVEQRVEAAVDGGGEQHQQTQLLPHPQPGVQPEGKTGVLGAPGMVSSKGTTDPRVEFILPKELLEVISQVQAQILSTFHLQNPV